MLVQVRYLLDDERRFADKLIDDSKMKLSLLAVVLGLGLFKIESLDHLYAALQTSRVLGGIFTVALFFGLLSLVIAVILIACERGPLRLSSWIHRLSRSATGVVRRLFRRRPESTGAESGAEDFDPREKFSAALVVLFGDRTETDSMGSDMAWLTQRIEETRLAYLRLAEGNRRVRKRLEYGTLALLGAFSSVIVVIGTVAWSSLTTHAAVPDGIVQEVGRGEDSSPAEKARVRPGGGHSEAASSAGRDPQADLRREAP